MASNESLDPLYATPPGEFVRERNALAARLAKAGDPHAREVKALPRPTAAVWAMNALARERPEQIAALLRAGDRLRGAQRDALQGRGGEGLRRAGAELGEVLAQLVDEATGLVGRSGPSLTAGVLKRIEDGLRAVALSGGELASRLRAGHVEREPELPALETIAASAPPPDAGSKEHRPRQVPAKEKDARRSTRAAAVTEEQAAAAARVAAKRADAEARIAAAEDALRSEERSLERLEREADEAARKASEARRRVDRARAGLAKLKKEASPILRRPQR